MKTASMLGILLLFLSIAFSASGQLLINPKFGLGIPVTDFSKDNIAWEGKTALRVGADLRIGRQAFRLMPGLHVQRQSFELDLLGGVREQINVTSLQVPVQAAYYLTSRENPINLLLRAGVNGALTIGESDRPTGVPFATATNTFALGAIGGLTLDLAIITIDLSFQQSLMADFEEAEEKGGILLFSLGYLF